MSLELKFIVSQLVIVLPFLVGYAARDMWKNRTETAQKIIRYNLVFFEPPIVFWSIWGLDLQKDMAVLPFAGLLMVIAGFLLGKSFAPFLKFHPKSERTFVISSSLANHGFTLGGLLCFIFGGERGLALSTIFILYFVPFTFIFIFFYAGRGCEGGIRLKSFVQFFFNLRNAPLFAAFLSLIIKCFGIERPDIYFPLDILLIVSVALYYFTLGTNFVKGDLNPFKKEHFIIALQKFILIPGMFIIILNLTQFSHEVKRVIMIQSFMPAAIYSVITAILFELDDRLASSMFVVNSLMFLLLIMPLMFFFNRYFS